jgi:hypothetical protein
MQLCSAAGLLGFDVKSRSIRITQLRVEELGVIRDIRPFQLLLNCCFACSRLELNDQ